ncbi:MAG: cupin domain-containing protein [Myxococcota bacterium]
MAQLHFPDPVRSLPPFDGPFDAFRLSADGCEVLFASYPAGASIERRYVAGDWYHLAPGQLHSARFEVHTSEIEFWFEV